MNIYTKLCATLSRWSLRAAVLGLVVLIACVQWQVLGRYLLNDSPTWTEPVALLLVLYITALAVAVGEEPDTIEEVYEPYLIMEGYLNRTAQGRVATELSFKKLGLKAAGGAQSRLF